MRGLVSSVLRGNTVAQLHQSDALLLRAGVTVPTSPLDEPIEDWDDPVTVASVRVDVQPATAQAQEAFGVTVAQGRYVIYSDPVGVPVAPVTNRFQVGERQYVVISARAWPSHVEALCEEVG